MGRKYLKRAQGNGGMGVMVSHPPSSTSSPRAAQGNGGAPSRSFSSPVLWGPTHGMHSSSRTAPDMGPYHGVHPSGENCSNLAARSQVTCSCMGCSPRATGPARNLLRQGSSTGSSLRRCRSTCSTVVSSTGCSVEPCSTVVLHGLQGDILLHHGPQAAGDFCSGASSTSPPPSTLTLAPAKLFLTPFTLPATVCCKRTLHHPVNLVRGPNTTREHLPGTQPDTCMRAVDPT